MRSHRILWTFVVTSLAAFMVNLDNLVVTMALPAIRADLDASLGELEWTVNAYTLSFAVFLLTAAALGDRLGRLGSSPPASRSSPSPAPRPRSRHRSKRSSSPAPSKAWAQRPCFRSR